MKAFRIRLLSAVGLLLSSVILSASGAVIVGAQPANQHITLTPSSAELSLTPGTSKSGSVTMINQGLGAFDIAFTVAPYYIAPDDVSYEPKFEPLEGSTNADQWVKLSSSEKKNVQPGDVVEVGYTVTAPASAPAGGYYAVVFAETSPTNPPPNGVIAHNRVGQILYITVEGEVRESGEIQNDQVPAVTFGTKIDSSSIVKNTGGKHFKTTYTTSIHSVFGKEVFHDTKDAYVLPQTKRKLQTSWDGAALVGLYKVSRSATLPQGTVSLADTWVLTVQPSAIVMLLGVIVIGGGLVFLKRKKL